MKTPDTSLTPSPIETAFISVFPNPREVLSDFDKLGVIYQMVSEDPNLAATLYTTLLGNTEHQADKVVAVKKHLLELQAQIYPEIRNFISAEENSTPTTESSSTETSATLPVSEAKGGGKRPKRRSSKYDYTSTKTSSRYQIGITPPKI